MNFLKNTVAAVVASAALAGCTADTPQAQEPDYTDAEKQTIATLEEFNTCAEGKVNSLTEADFENRVAALTEQYQDDLAGVREQIRESNPGITDEEVEMVIEQFVMPQIYQEAFGSLVNDAVIKCSVELEVDLQQLQQDVDELNRKYPLFEAPVPQF